MNDLIVAGTGHRPDKLGGYSKDVKERLCSVATEWLKYHDEVGVVISGMALGWDQALVRAAQNLGICTIAAVPFEGQEILWPRASQVEYRTLLQRCDEVRYISKPGYSKEKMQVRNRWMVDRCDLVLALWDGTRGGTANCLEYADMIGREYENLWENFQNSFDLSCLRR